MNIYIDFDDCLCETAKDFSVLVKKMFGKNVPYEQIKFFDLQKSFELSETEFVLMMNAAHTADKLLSIEETPNASEVINRWIDKGHKVNIITGRPYSTYEASRQWLINHNLDRATLYCLDKYGRENLVGARDYSLELDDYYKMKFDFAVEDSPKAFKYLTHLENCRVTVFDRPWNKEAVFPSENFIRCNDWKEIDRIFQIQS